MLIITKQSQLPLLNSIVEDALNYEVVFIDLFCGAGGVTSGIEEAMVRDRKVAKVIACINHDAVAIASHHANWKDSLHLTEDIRTAELTELRWMVGELRKRKPEIIVCMWASLECTNFSKAKGGLPRNADSRTLAEHLYRYVDALAPDMVWIENVEEFLSWGPLDENGKPVSRDNGKDFQKWRAKLERYEYYCEHRILNSADYGAYTSRKRLFIQFSAHGLPIVWPKPTHAKKTAKGSLFSGLQKWKPVSEVLNFSDEGESIFAREKPLAEKTLERVLAGLIKFVANGDTSWLLKYNSINGQTGKHVPPSIDEPCPTIAAQNRLGLVQTKFLQAHYSNGDNVTSVENPCPTLTTKDRFSLVQPIHFLNTMFGSGQKNIRPANRKWHYIMTPQWGVNCSSSVDNPAPTLIARMDKTPPYIITTESGQFAIEVYESDSPTMVKIKQFMATYGIVDIKMRMLRVPELLKIQGFHDGYVLYGTQADQKKFIGNSVPPKVVRAMIEASFSGLYETAIAV